MLSSSYSKTVQDDFLGNAAGWNPNGALTTFNIVQKDPPLTAERSTIVVNIIDSRPTPPQRVCNVSFIQATGGFRIDCLNAPSEGSTLKYHVINQMPLFLEEDTDLPQNETITNGLNMSNMTK